MLQAPDYLTQPLALSLANIADIFAGDTTLYFVTNVSEATIAQPDDHKHISHLAQYYTEKQANLIISTLRNIGFTVVPFFSETEFLEYMTAGTPVKSPNRFQLVYTTAEGGTGSARRALIPKAGALFGLPSCNSGAYGSSLARHKYDAIVLARHNGVSVPQTWLYSNRSGWRGRHAPPAGRHVILKPNHESSAIGVSNSSVVEADGKLETLCAEISEKWDRDVIIQEFIRGTEIAVPVVEVENFHICPLVGFGSRQHPVRGKRFRTLSYEISEKAKTFYPPNTFSGPLLDSIAHNAIRAFEAVDLSVLGRIDMRIDPDGGIFVFDINESPPPLPDTAFLYSMSQLNCDYENTLKLVMGLNLYKHFPQCTGYISDQYCSSHNGKARP